MNHISYHLNPGSLKTPMLHAPVLWAHRTREASTQQRVQGCLLPKSTIVATEMPETEKSQKTHRDGKVGRQNNVATPVKKQNTQFQ